MAKDNSSMSQEIAQIDSADHGLSIAIVHDWCPSFRGGERVVAEMCRLYPQAKVFTLFDFLPKDVKEVYFRGVEFHTSVANRLPFVKKYYRALFFACPFLIEQFDVTGYDAVISSSAAFARGVLTRPDQPHFCYVHSPVRYAWDEQFSYLAQANLGYGPKGLLFRRMLYKLRIWDSRTAHGPDLMAANSNFVRSRIRHIYGRDALVIFPPVEVDKFDFVEAKQDYYITASFLAPYKRTDLVIQAFNEMPHRRLHVVGDGQQSAKLRKLAGPNISFLGFLPRKDYVKQVSEARALVFAGCEDFGIALAEAQASGTPLIAFKRGGASDIVRPLGAHAAPTGILFERQTVDALKQAVAHFEDNAHLISPAVCRENAERFAPARFQREIAAALDQTLDMHKRSEATSSSLAERFPSRAV
jgi:glycosyltransferase involved in cell wall biosynthesis